METEAPEKPPRKKRWKRWLLWSVGAMALLFALGTLWVRFYLDPYLKDWLSRQVDKGSAGKYKLKIQSLKFRLWRMSLEVRGVRLYSLKPRETEGLNLYLEAQELHIKQVDWWEYWRTQKIKVEAVELHAPTIDLYNPLVRKQLNIKDLPAQIRDFVGKITPAFSLNRLHLHRAKCLLNANTPTGKVYHQFTSLDLTLDRLQIRTASPTFDAKRDISLGNFELKVLNYNAHSPDDFYSLHCQTLQASMQDSSITLRYVRVAPRKENTARDKITLQLPYMRTKGINFFDALHKQNIKIRTVEARNTQLKIETKTAPTLQNEQASAPVPFPKDLRLQIHSFPVPIAIDTLLITKVKFHFKQPVSHLAHVGYHQAEEASVAIYKVRIGQAHNPFSETEAGFDMESGLPFFAKSISLTVKNFEHEPASGQYRFGVKLMHLSSQDSLLFLEKAYLKPTLPAPEIAKNLAYQNIISTVELPSLVASKVDFEKMLYQQVFRLGSLHLYAPKYEGFLDATKPKQKGQKFQNFEQMLRSIPLDIQADMLGIHDAKVTYKSLQKTHNQDSTQNIATHTLEKLNLQIQKIDLGRALNESAIEHIDTKKLQIKAQNYTYQDAKGDYVLKAESIEALAEKHLVAVQNLQLLPTTQNTSVDKLRLDVPQMRGEGVDFVSFMLKQKMDWDKLTVKGAKIALETQNIRTDSEKTTKNLSKKEAQSLSQTLQNLPVFVRLDTLAVQEATFILEEKDNISEVKSRHQIEKMDAQLLDITLGRATRYDLDSTARFWEEQSLAFALQKYTYEAQNLTYRFTLQNIQKQAQNHIWRIEALAWKSVLNLQECRTKFPERHWLAEGTLQSITLEVQDLEKILFQKQIAIQRAHIQEPKLKFWLFQKETQPETITSRRTTDALALVSGGGFENLPLHLSVDTLSLQSAKIACFSPDLARGEGQYHWQQHTELDLGVSRFELNKKITWERINLVGKAYTLQHPNAHLKVQSWLLALDQTEPRFYAKNVQFSIPKDASVQGAGSSLTLTEISATLPAVGAGKVLKVKDLQLRNGKGELYLYPQKTSKNIEKPISTLLHTFASSLYIENIDLKVHQNTPKHTQTHTFFIEQAKINAHDSTQKQALDGFVKIRDYETSLRQHLYKTSAQSIFWDLSLNELTIKKLSTLPTISEKVLNRQQTHQKERYQARIGTLKMRNFDIFTLLQKRELRAGKVVLDSLDLQISADRRLPTRSRRKRMPAQILRSMKMPLQIDTVLVNHLNLSYQEKVAGTPKAGKLFVNNIYARLIGLTNRPTPQDSLRLQVAGKLMDLGDADLELTMALLPDMYAKVRGKMGRFNANFMNDFLEATRHILIRKGEVQGARFWLSMQDSTAIGVLEAGYKHLRLDILSAKKENKRRGFITFLANIFINNRNNIDRKRHKVGDILYTRPAEETFVRFLVRSLAMGILNTLK